MSPFRVPATGGTPIGENGIEQQGAESGGADEQSEGGQLAAGRSQRVAGAELSASQADLGAVSGGGREGPAAWQLRAAVEPGLPEEAASCGAGTGEGPLRRFRAYVGGRTSGQRRRTRSACRDAAALDAPGRAVAKTAAAQAVSSAAGKAKAPSGTGAG